jgi:hypothetical protein
VSRNDFEDAVRKALQEASPSDVPRSLEDSVLRIPATRARVGRAFGWGRGWAPVLLIAVVVATGSIAFAAIRAIPGAGTPQHPLQITSPFGLLSAADIDITVGGASVSSGMPASAGPNASFTGTATFGQVMINWEAGGRPYVLLMHFAANRTSWWLSDAEVTDGRPSNAGWIYFEGPSLETPLGGTFDGSLTLPSVRSTFGEAGTISLGQLRLKAFQGFAPHDPAIGTMPLGGSGSGVPAYVPVDTNGAGAGYVSSTWLTQTPITSFEGQPPDQPVFAADLRTVIGYMVAGRGFVPGQSPLSS